MKPSSVEKHSGSTSKCDKARTTGDVYVDNAADRNVDGDIYDGVDGDLVIAHDDGDCRLEDQYATWK